MRTAEQIADAYLDGMERGEHSNFRARMTDAIRTAQHETAKAQPLWHAATDRAGKWERKAGKIIEQAGAWKRRALAAESDLELAREQARYREGELVRSGHQQLLEAQSNALDTIQRIAAQLPVDPIIDAKVVVPDVEVDTWFGEDDTPVVQIDTHRGHGRLRINLNDGVVWDGDPETDERPGKNAELVEWEQRALAQAETISRQLDTIRDQAEKIEQLEEQLRLAVQHGVEHEARTREAEDKAETLARRMDHNVRSFRALEARKVELEAEVLAERGALAVCQTQLTDTKAELAESRRAFDAMDSRNRELAEKVSQLEEQRAEAARNLSQVSAERVQAWRDLDVSRVADLDALRAEKAEAITHCNEQLEALAKAAKLRDRQVQTLSRLWVAKTDDERALFGTVFARQLYRVFADHGIDVEHDMPAYPANVGVLITPAERLVTEAYVQLAQQHSLLQRAAFAATEAYVQLDPDAERAAMMRLRELVGLGDAPAPERPVTDRIIREYNHLREHAELVLQADMRNGGRFIGYGLRSALTGLRDAVNNGAPEPTPDIADCA